MKKQEIDAYAELMHKWNLSGLSVSEEGTTLVLVRPELKIHPDFTDGTIQMLPPGSPGPPAQTGYPGSPAGPAQVSYAGRTGNSPRQEQSPESSAGTVPAHSGQIPSGPVSTSVIISPMVGVFYASPAENEEPYVSVGDHVKAGQTLCIIEAMKLMNEIQAEEDSVIEEICVKNGQVVEFGTELFRVRKEAV